MARLMQGVGNAPICSRGSAPDVAWRPNAARRIMSTLSTTRAAPAISDIGRRNCHPGEDRGGFRRIGDGEMPSLPAVQLVRNSPTPSVGPAKSSRDPRLDALRGPFLVIMAAVHIPTPLSHAMQEPFGFTSAAEGFVFLGACLAGLFTGKFCSATVGSQCGIASGSACD